MKRMPATAAAAVQHYGLYNSDLPEIKDHSFLEAYDCLMQGDQERLFAMTVTSAEFDILRTDDKGLSLVHWSVKHDKLPMCKFMMERCCRSDKVKESLRNSKDKSGKTALHYAAMGGRKNFVKMLAVDIKSVNVKDIMGRTPLHYCVGVIAYRECTHILVDMGSRIYEKDVEGASPASIESSLPKIQELSVAGAFSFINNLNFLERTGKRIDSGVDVACSDKTSNESEPAGFSLHSPDSCYSPRMDNSLSSSHEKIRPPPSLNGSLAWCEEESEGPGVTSDKMKTLREELSRLINLLNNTETHQQFVTQLSVDRTASKLVIIAQYPLLPEDCANAVSLLLQQLFSQGAPHVSPSILRLLVKLLDSHPAVQSQAISALEHYFSVSRDDPDDMDYTSEFAELDPTLILSLLHDTEIPTSTGTGGRRVPSSEVHASRLRSISSPCEVLSEGFKAGHSYFTRNWSKRLLIRILSRTSLTIKMRLKMICGKVVWQLCELLECGIMEVREHTLATLANIALSGSSHGIFRELDVSRRFKDHLGGSAVCCYHATRGLVYLGETCLSNYIYDHNLKGQGIDDDRIWARNREFGRPEEHYIKASTLEDIVVIMTSNPSLLWNDIMLRRGADNDGEEVTESSREEEIIRFVLSLHRTFSDSIVFLRLLIHRFMDPNVTITKRHRLEIPPVYLKVCKVLCIWLEEFPWHFAGDREMLMELEDFSNGLEDRGPVYYDLKDQIALKCQRVQYDLDGANRLGRVTHLDQYTHCRASLLSEEFPLPIKSVSWLSALRGVIERRTDAPQTQPTQRSFISSLLNFRSRAETTSWIRSLIPPSYQQHPDVVSLTRNLYDHLVDKDLDDREWQHLFVEAYFSHPLYKTELFYDIEMRQGAWDTLPVVVGVNAHHFVVVSRLSHEIIGHHALTSLQQPIQWYAKPMDNVVCVPMETEYQLIGTSPSEVETLVTVLVQHMGDKIEIVETVYATEEEEFGECDELLRGPGNRHSWHAPTAITRNGYGGRMDCPPTTPCHNSYMDVSQVGREELLSTARSRLSLNLSHSATHRNGPANSALQLRRVHTTNDVSLAATLQLVEDTPRQSLTDKLRSFSTSLSSRLDHIALEQDTMLQKDPLGPATTLLPPNNSCLRPDHQSKRRMKRSPRISPRNWERGYVKIDAETAQETVIVTEKCSVLCNLKSSGASTPASTPDQPSHIRVRNTSSFRNIDPATFTKLLAQSVEMMEERKRAARRNSVESVPRALSVGGGGGGRRVTGTSHRLISRSKTYPHTFDQLLATPSPPVETPVELEQFSCLREEEETSAIYKIRKAQDNLFNVRCTCPDVTHYTPCPCAPQRDLPYDFDLNYRRWDEVKLLSFHREIARQLTLRDHYLFANVSEEDLLGYTKKLAQPISDYPTIKYCTEHCRQIVNTVISIILSCEESEERITLLEHFIDIAHQCLLLRNFFALFAIASSALASSAVRNISHNLRGISPRHQAIFDQLLKITHPSAQNKVYHTLLRLGGSSPAVPFLNIHMTRLISLNTECPDYLKRGLINLRKRRLLYKELEELRWFQRQSYNLIEVPEIIDFFALYETLPEEEFYLRSEMAKRKEAERARRLSKKR